MSSETKATGFYNTKAWKDTRRNYKQSKGNLCERCLKQGKITPADVVHHKEPLTMNNINDLNISLGWGNLEALCNQCHADVHEEIYRKRTHKRYKIDKLTGRVIIV